MQLRKLTQENVQLRLCEFLANSIPMPVMVELTDRLRTLNPQMRTALSESMALVQTFLPKKETAFAYFLCVALAADADAAIAVISFLMAAEGVVAAYPKEQSSVQALKKLYLYVGQDSEEFVREVNRQSFDRDHFDAAIAMLDGTTGTMPEFMNELRSAMIREISNGGSKVTTLMVSLAILVYGVDMLSEISKEKHNAGTG